MVQARHGFKLDTASTRYGCKLDIISNWTSTYGLKLDIYIYGVNEISSK